MRPDTTAEPSCHKDHGVPVTKTPQPAPPPHPTPCPGVMASYLPPPRCPRGQCPGHGSAAPRCGRRGSPSPSRARTPSRLRWHSRRFSPANKRGAELPAVGLLRPAGSFLTCCKVRSTQNPSLGFGVHSHHGWGKCCIFFSCSEMVPAGLNPIRSWTLHGPLGLTFSFLVWEAAYPTQMCFSPPSNPTSAQAADK